jgi:hypothetical protein
MSGQEMAYDCTIAISQEIISRWSGTLKGKFSIRIAVQFAKRTEQTIIARHPCMGVAATDNA